MTKKEALLNFIKNIQNINFYGERIFIRYLSRVEIGDIGHILGIALYYLMLLLGGSQEQESLWVYR